MSALAEPGLPSGRRGQVLALLADLAPDLGDLSLDEIDGEFFWRGARADLLDRVEALRAARPLRGPDDPGPGPDAVFAYLRAGMERVAAFTFMHLDASHLYPDAVWRRMLAGDRVPMRDPEAQVRLFLPSGTADDADGGEVRTLRVKVFSGSWTGDDVEGEVERLLACRDEELGPSRGEGSGVSIRIDFDFVGDEVRARSDGSAFSPPRFPYVEVAAPFPLPPAGVIGRDYDAVVRGHKQWHLALPGGTATRQEKEVAVRTWTVALLMAAGDRFSGAMRVACAAAGLCEVTQARFGQDRQRLLDRVPEAKPHLLPRR